MLNRKRPRALEERSIEYASPNGCLNTACTRYHSIIALLVLLISTTVDSLTTVHSSRTEYSLKLLSRKRDHVDLIYEAPHFDPHHRNNNIESIREDYSFWDGPITTTSFNMDLKNLADEEAQKAQDALEIMEELYRQSTETQSTDNSPTQYVQPNAACYTTVIDGWLHSSHPEAVYKIQALLDRMEMMYDETGDEALRPNVVTYMLVCQAWCDADTHDFAGGNVERAEEIVEQMKKRGIHPDVKVYTSVLYGWCKRAGKVRGAMERAEKLLSEMEMGSTRMNDTISLTGKQHHDSIKPNVITYTTVLSGLCRSKENDIGFRAEAILERMERNCVEPDMVTYTSVLSCWSKVQSWKERDIAAGRAVSILKEMERKYAAAMYHVKPNLLTYSTAISAIGNSLEPNVAYLAENILRHMYAIHNSNQITGIKPTTATYNAVINALARNMKGNKVKCATRAEELLNEMMQRSADGEINIDPDSHTWGGVILAWAQCGNPTAASNAQRILDTMQTLYRSGKSKVQPNVVCFTTVMRAWSSIKRDDALDKAEGILIAMEERYGETQDEKFRPTAISYITMIDAFIRNNEAAAALRAQNMVDRMVRLYGQGKGYIRPNRIVYNSLINAWSRSSEIGAAIKAEQILQWMEAQYRSGDIHVRPDEVTFCGVLNAWANKADQGGAERAQQILEHMESLSPEDRGFQQTVKCHNVVIKAWSRSGAPDAVRKTEELLEQLEGRDDLKPDAKTYSSAINCCAYFKGPEEGKTEAFATAMRMFTKLSGSKEHRPNNITYGTMFKAIAKLTDMNESRHELVRRLFEKCIHSGSVDGFVLSQLRGASPEVFRDLVLAPLKMTSSAEAANILAVLDRMPATWGRKALANY